MMSQSKHLRSALGGLIITRREGEQIVINHGELRIEVVSVKGRTVRLAFRANVDISIQRAEVFDGLSWKKPSEPELSAEAGMCNCCPGADRLHRVPLSQCRNHQQSAKLPASEQES